MAVHSRDQRNGISLLRDQQHLSEDLPHSPEKDSKTEYMNAREIDINYKSSLHNAQLIISLHPEIEQEYDVGVLTGVLTVPAKQNKKFMQ